MKTKTTINTWRGLSGILYATLAISLVGLPALSHSQELEEIIVTAQKREQNLQEVGVSVTAFTDNQIRELGFVNTTDVVAMTPGLNFTIPNAEASVVNFFLRGVGLNDFADAQENPVAVYMDDVYRPAMGGLHFQLFDMERVEVLRGPQGALFGRNTTGGVVHYISKRPTSEPEGYIDVMIGDNSQVKVEGAISGGSDTVAGRLSLAANQHDGYVSNRFTPNAFVSQQAPDYAEMDSIAARGQLLFNLSDDVELLLSAQITENDGVVGAWQHQATRPGGDPSDPTALDTSIALGPNDMNEWCVIFEFDQFDPGTDCLGFFGAPGVLTPEGIPEVGIDSDGDPWAGNYGRSGGVKTENQSFAADLNWQINDLQFTSITSITNVDRLQEEDTEMGPLPLLEPTFRAETDTFTQEFRLASTEGSVRWLAGVYYFDNEVNGMYDLDTTQILDFVFLDTDYKQETESWAAFGQIEFDLSDAWTLIAGVRFTDEEKKINFENIDTWGTIGFCSTNDFACGVPATPISPWRPTADHAVLFSESSVGSLAKHEEDYVTGKIELDYKVNDDMMIYGSYSRGAKSPGFNSGFIDTTGLFAANIVVPSGDPLCSALPFTNSTACSDLPFKREELNAFEVGFKSMIGGATRFNAAAFYYDYTDMQVFAFQFFNQVIFNADAEMFGAEFELQSSPMDGLDLQLGLSLLDATAENIPTRDSGSIQDRTPVAAPEVTFNALVRYEWPAFDGMWSVQAWGNYQSETFYDILNHPVSKEDGYTVVNFRTSYVSSNENWEIYAFVNNAFEEEYLSYTFDFTIPFGFNQRAFGPPRWWGAGFRYGWGN